MQAACPVHQNARTSGRFFGERPMPRAGRRQETCPNGRPGQDHASRPRQIGDGTGRNIIWRLGIGDTPSQPGFTRQACGMRVVRTSVGIWSVSDRPISWGRRALRKGPATAVRWPKVRGLTLCPAWACRAANQLRRPAVVPNFKCSK